MEIEWLWQEGAVPANLLTRWSQAAAAQKDLGAFTFFCGQVRADQNEQGKVKGIEYSAYSTMAESTLREFVETHPLSKEIKLIKIAQSLGFVAAGELSLVLLLATAHRKELLQLQLELVEFLKFKVPVWKKELFEQGNYRWVNA